MTQTYNLKAKDSELLIIASRNASGELDTDEVIIKNAYGNQTSLGYKPLRQFVQELLATFESGKVGVIAWFGSKAWAKAENNADGLKIRWFSVTANSVIAETNLNSEQILAWKEQLKGIFQ